MKAIYKHLNILIMKRFFLLLAFAASLFTTANLGAQEARPLTVPRMIAPYALEVCLSKTVHILFPAAIRYVDLGSSDLLAAKAGGAENVLRVKAAVQGFTKETNLSVITEDGSFYVFNVRYTDEPLKLSVEMASHGQEGERPANTIPVSWEELGGESPRMLDLIMKSIHTNNRRPTRHTGSKCSGIRYRLRGIYIHGGLLYFHTELKNSSHLPFDVDYITFRVVDKKVAKRTAIQETILHSVRSFNMLQQIGGKHTERTVFALPKFTLAGDKKLLIELNEKGGGRQLSLTIENSDLTAACLIDDLN
jgi:conjugative transposon TraN protein